MVMLTGGIVDHNFDPLVGRKLQAFFDKNNFIGVGAYVPTNNYKPRVAKTFLGFSISTVDLVYYHVCDEQLELIHEGYTRLHLAYINKAASQKKALGLEVNGAWLLIQARALRDEELIAEGDKVKSLAGNKAIREVSKQMGQAGTFFLSTQMPRGKYLQKVYTEMINQLGIHPHLWLEQDQKRLLRDFLRLVKARIEFLVNEYLVQLLNLLVKAFKREIDNREMAVAYAELQIAHQQQYDDLTKNIDTTRIVATAEALIVSSRKFGKQRRKNIKAKYGKDAEAILAKVAELLAIPQ